MNKKLSTYILLAIFIGIWAFVGFSIYGYFSKDESNTLPINTSEATSFQTDTFSLLANYTDPFTSKSYNNVAINKPVISTNIKATNPARKTPDVSLKTSVIVTPKINVPVYFKGVIDNIHTKNKVAIIRVNNSDVLLKIGEQYQDITLKSISSESILIQRKGEKVEKIVLQ